MDITQRIKEEREKRGIKQVDMANFLNLERSNYTRLENRGSKLTLDQIAGIASAIGISPAVLLGLDVKEEQHSEVNDSEKDKEMMELKKRVMELEDRINDKELRIEMYSEIIYELVENLKKVFESNIVAFANNLKLGIIEWTFDINYMFIERVNFNLNNYKRQSVHIGYTTNKEDLESYHRQGDKFDNLLTTKKYLILDTNDLEKIFTLMGEDEDFFDSALYNALTCFPESYIKQMGFLSSELLNTIFNIRVNEKTAHKIITQIYDVKNNRIANNVVEFDSFKLLKNYPSNINTISYIRKDILTRIQDYLNN
jgi:transcriptional regulator with XRE-family HTH domain